MEVCTTFISGEVIMLELLRDKIYIRYWLAVVVSFLGDAITLTTVVYIIGSSTNSVLMISFVFVSQLLPIVILGPFIGPLIDKVQKRYVLVLSDIYRLVLVGLMFLLQEQSIVLLVLLFLMGIGTAFFEPARIASVPTIVGMQRIPQGIALFQSTSAVIKFFGPVLAGLTIANWGVSIVFIYDMISYAISAILLYSLTVLDTKAVYKLKMKNYYKELTDGYKSILNIPIIKNLSLVLMPVMLSMGIFIANYKGMMFQIFKVSPFEFGWLEGIFAAGVVIGAMFGPTLISRYGLIRLIKSSLLFVGICFFSVYFLPSVHSISGLYPILFWSIIIGFGESLLQVPTSNIILTNIPPELRGQGISLTNSMMNLFFLLGTLLGGVLSIASDTQLPIFISGIILCITYVLTRSTNLGTKKPVVSA